MKPYLQWLCSLLLLTVVSCTDGISVPFGVDGLPFNFYELDDNRTYRSGQPTADQIATIVQRYGIKTVVNLRGENVGKEWYDAEVAECAALGVNHVDHRMSASSLPPPEVLEDLTQTLLTAEYPIMFHCDSGSDRSGLVSVIYRMLILGDGRAEALSELSASYFHFRFDAPCMDTVAEMYEPGPEWLAEYAATFDQIQCQ